MSRTKKLTRIGLVTALICVISPVVLITPFSPVPISLATFMLYLATYILDKKEALISCLIYILIGLIGIPVFSGFSGGIGKVFGPTGGYLLGYVLIVYFGGWFVEKWYDKKWMQALGHVFGTLCCYLLGSIWLAYQADMTIMEAMAAGMLPFIPGDIIKILLAISVGSVLRKRLKQAGVL